MLSGKAGKVTDIRRSTTISDGGESNDENDLNATKKLAG